MKLNHQQLSLWRAAALDPNPARFQCAELMQWEGGDPHHLARIIRKCSDSVPIFSMVLDEERLCLVPADPAPVSIRQEADPDFDAVVAAGEGLVEHIIFDHGNGRFSWLARFHHLLGDGFFFQAFIRWVCQSYSAETPNPFLVEDPAPAPQDIPVLPRPVSAVSLTQARGMRPAPAGQAVQRAYASATLSAPVRVENLVHAVAEATCRIADVDSCTVGIPMMNRPLGQRTVVAAPLVTMLPLTFVEGDSPEQVAEQFQQLRPLAAYPTEALRQAAAVSDPRTHLTGAHINFRPFVPRLSFGDIPVSFQTLALGPVDDIELAFNTAPGGVLELHAFAHVHRDDQPLLADLTTRLMRFIEQGSFLAPEDHAQLEAFNSTDRVFPRMTLPSLIHHTISQALKLPPISDFCWHNGEILSNHDLYGMVLSYADWLSARRQPDAPVVIILPRSPEFIAMVAACALTGIPWVPIDPSLPQARREYMCETAQPFLIVEPHTLPPITPSTQSTSASMPPLHEVAPEDIAYMLFTSGSTGKPKCALNTQQGIANRLNWMAQDYSLSSRIMHKTSCSFDVSVWEILFPFTHGLPVAVATEGAHKDPGVLAEQLRASGTTHCHFVPSALTAFLISSPSCPDLHTIFTSGEALATDVAAAATAQLGVTIHNLYGPTEAAIDVTAFTVTGEDNPIPIGFPVANTQMFVVDRHGDPLPVGYEGNLFIGGIQVGAGYLQRPDLTAERFIDGRYDTGDRGSWRADGALLYAGRSDFQVKLRGQRLELGEIEAVLRSIPGLIDASVQARPIAGDLTLIAYVITDLSESSLRRALQQQLPEYMVPQFFVFMQEFPLNPAGKLDRKALPDPQFDDSSAEPMGEQESQIYEIFRALLGLESFNPHRSFFELGGNSLSAIRLLADLSEAGFTLTLADLFAHSSPHALAAFFSSSATDSVENSGFSPILPIRSGNSRPIFCIYPAGGLGWTYTRLLDILEPDRPVFALQAPALSGGSLPTSVDQSAAALADVIVENAPEGATLIGWSIGGVLAQAVAARIPEHIDVVHLLDAYPAEAWAHKPEPTDSELLEGILTMAGVDAPASTLTPEIVAAILRESGSLFAQLPEETIGTIIDLIAAHARIMRSHHTRPTSVPMVHYKARLTSEDLDAHQWENYASTVRFEEYDCTHPQIIDVLVRNQNLITAQGTR
ncbi:MAG: amino acid adenylation domain-containing protein [Corynebacterium sp.]|nr:amino acid adenylation domain-containing protein [Corynebacterium sp.]